MTSIENMVRAELERMGVKSDEDEQQQDTAEQPQYVPVEAVLSNAIGGNLDPETILRGTISLNDDNALAKMLGADTLNGQKF